MIMRFGHLSKSCYYQQTVSFLALFGSFSELFGAFLELFRIFFAAFSDLFGAFLEPFSLTKPVLQKTCESEQSFANGVVYPVPNSITDSVFQVLSYCCNTSCKTSDNKRFFWETAGEPQFASPNLPKPQFANPTFHTPIRQNPPSPQNSPENSPENSPKTR